MLSPTNAHLMYHGKKQFFPTATRLIGEYYDTDLADELANDEHECFIVNVDSRFMALLYQLSCKFNILIS